MSESTVELRLPPDCKVIDPFNGTIVRVVRHYKYASNDKGEKISEYELDSEGDPVVEWVEERPVAKSLEEARAKRIDYYSQEYGWIIEGYKLQRDRDTQSILEK